MTDKKPKKVPERFSMVMAVGEINGAKRYCWVAADEFTAERLKRKGYGLGDVVGAEFKKPRDGRNWRRIHKLAQLLIEHVDEFGNYTDPHKVIKRLQLEGNIGCESTAIRIEGLGMVEHRTPVSLAFDAMEDGDFNEIHAQFCQHVINKYWAGLEQYQVMDMERLVGLAA